MNHLIENALRTILAHPKNPESFAYAKRVLAHYDANPPTTGEVNMSLEAQITELNQNLKTIIYMLGEKTGDDAKAIADAKGNKADDAARQALQDKRDPAKQPAAITPEVQAELDRVKAANKAAAAKKSDTASAPSTPAAATSPSEAVDYEKQLKPAVLSLATKKGRDTLISVLKKFDNTEPPSAKNVKPEQYAELLKALQAAAA